MEAIKYYSTNQSWHPQAETGSITFGQALLKGLADDQGLYMFNRIPQLELDTFLSYRGKPYHELAFYILNHFLAEEIPPEKLQAITQASYGIGSKWPQGVQIPLEPYPHKTWIARLDQGPTASFKDFAAQLMARLMQYFREDQAMLTILVATSGDTGSAVGEAFRGLEGTQVIILYPKQEVSPIQKKQLESMGQNVIALSIDGKFDDCQNFVKQAFVDSELGFLNLTSANSINIGRLLPQIVYYAYIYLQISQAQEPIIFSIPSGNLGNSLGAEVARQMGVPIQKIIIGTNANATFPNFLKNGKYEKISPSKKCVSNAMNVGNPSNAARYFHLYEGSLDKNGQVHHPPNWEEMKACLVGYAFSDEETIQIMQEFYQQEKVIVEPHGAIGLLALHQYRNTFPENQDLPAVCMETAHPGKFPEIVQKYLATEPGSTPALDILNNREGQSIELANDYVLFKEFLKNMHHE